MPKVVGYDETVYKRATCRSCGAINEYSPKEVVRLGTGGDYSGHTWVKYGFMCAGPGCAAEVVVIGD